MEFVSVLCLQNVSLPMTEKSLVLASIRGNIVFAAVGKQMHRPFGSVPVETLWSLWMRIGSRGKRVGAQNG